MLRPFYTMHLHYTTYQGPIRLDVSTSEQALFMMAKCCPGILSIVSFFIIVVTCLAMANPKRSSSFVWTTFVDESGWQSSAATFLTGLTSPNFGLGGLDGPIHLSEDTFDPARTVPLSILVSLVTGCVSALLFVVAMLYCIADLPSLISSRTGYELFPARCYLYSLLSEFHCLRCGSRQPARRL